MDFVDFVVIQGEPGHFAQSGEGSLRQNRDVVLAEVEVLQLSVVAEGQGRHLIIIITITIIIIIIIIREHNNNNNNNNNNNREIQQKK